MHPLRLQTGPSWNMVVVVGDNMLVPWDPEWTTVSRAVDLTGNAPFKRDCSPSPTKYTAKTTTAISYTMMDDRVDDRVTQLSGYHSAADPSL